MEGQARCAVCGEEEGAPSGADKKGSTPLENYIKCLDQNLQGSNLGGNGESWNEGMTCDSCSCNLSSVVDYVERMKEVKKEVSRLERTLHNKLRELKTTGKRVMCELGLIGELLGDRNKDSNLLQKEVYLLNLTEKASKGIHDTLRNLEEKQTLVKKWTCGTAAEAGNLAVREEVNLMNVTEKASISGIRDTLEGKQAFVRKSTSSPEVRIPEAAGTPVLDTSVTSLPTNNEFEESEVFQVKTEPAGLNSSIAVPSPSGTPVLEKAIKLEREPIRKTRQGVIHRTRVVSVQLDYIPLINVNADNQAAELETIEIEDYDNEAEVAEAVDLNLSHVASSNETGLENVIHPETSQQGRIPRVSTQLLLFDVPVNTTGDNEAIESEDDEAEALPNAPVASSSTSSSPPNQSPEKRKMLKRGPTISKGMANEGDLEPIRKSRRIAKKTRNAESESTTAEDTKDCGFLRKWVSEVLSLLENPEGVKELQNRLVSIPKLSSELFHELVVAFKNANQLQLLLADQNLKRGLHLIIERIPELDEQTLDILSEAKVDFNILDRKRRNVLYTAIKNHRSVSLLESLIKRGANVRQVNTNGRNLIHYGVSSGCTPEVLEYLISEIADVNGEDKNGTRPLALLRYVNSPTRRFRIFKVLVNAGAELRGRTPLHYYVYCKIEKSGRHFRELFEFIASKDKIGWFNIENERNQTPLHLFLRKFEIDRETLEMICQEQVDFTKVDEDGFGCLHYAMVGGNLNPEYLQRLVDAGADVKRLRSNKETLLHFAVRLNVPSETFEFLLGKGLDLTAVQIEGYTALDSAIEKKVRQDLLSRLLIWTFDAGVRHSNKWQLPMLHLAIEHGTPDVVEHMLLANDVNPNEPDQYGITPIWKAIGSLASLNPVEKAKLLVRHGANTNFHADDNGQTILHHAAKDITFATAAVKYCVEELGINVDSKDKDGKTPLLSIMFDSFPSKSQVEKAKILVLNGADVNAKPNPNVFVDEEMQLQSCLHLALYIDRFHSSDSLNLVKLLLEKGAKVNERSLGGWTPIQVATRSKNAAFLLKLLKKFGVNSVD